MHEYDKSSQLLCPPSTTLPAPDQQAADEKLLFLASSQLTIDSHSVAPRFQQFLRSLNTFNILFRAMS